MGTLQFVRQAAAPHAACWTGSDSKQSLNDNSEEGEELGSNLLRDSGVLERNLAYRAETGLARRQAGTAKGGHLALPKANSLFTVDQRLKGLRLSSRSPAGDHGFPVE